MHRDRSARARFLTSLATALLSASIASAQPTFTKVFAPDTIGPGSVTTLTFSISSASATPVTDLAFTDNLPAGVTLATPSNATTTCGGGTVTAPDGGTTISLTGGAVGAFGSCIVVVNVTSGTAGTHMNVSGDLTSSAGNSGPAADDLIVVTDRPGFDKLFVPSSVNLGQRSRLSLVIDNIDNASPATNLTFTDPLPTGMVVASPPDASASCIGGVVTAVPGSGTVSYGPAFFGDASVPSGSACSISVDVVATGPGSLGNITGDLTSIVGGFTTLVSGKASAVLDVAAPTVSLVKEFIDDPVVPGNVVSLRFTITNFDRAEAATGIAFTDDLGATLSGLSAVAPLPSDPCGAGSTLSGTSLLTLVGGSLGPGASCTFDITLQVPAGASSGTYPNTTTTLTADLGGVPGVYPAATDTLFVSAAPELAKEFVDDPVAAGGTVTLRFTVTNTDTTSSATALAFTDDLTAVIPGLSPNSLPAAGFCGAGSSITTIPGPSIGQLSLSMTGGQLAPGASCTFDVVLDVPPGAPNGSYVNTTSDITGTIGGEQRSGSPATDTLLVVAAPGLTKSFTDDPTPSGATVTLEFTLTHSPNAPAEATSITFTDDLDAVLPGLVAVGLPAADVCGTGSQVSGTNVLSFTGGSLAPGATCTIPVTLQVPAGATAGSYPNVTGPLTASVLGLPVTSPPATDSLTIAGLNLSKAFTDDPVVAGSVVTLSFTLTNASPVSNVTTIAFTDNLNAVLTGLAAVGLPVNDVCGAGSQISGTNLLTFTGGALAPGSSCAFDVTLQVPAATASGEYTNVTSPVSATVDGSPAVLPGATDTLIVADVLEFDKTFVDGAAAPGATTALEFIITNTHPTDPATGLSFTDDLDSALSGLAAVGLPANDVCGAGSQMSGTGLLTFTGGTLAAGASCTFTVTLQVPAGVSAGTVVSNVTGPLSGTVGGSAVTADPATADLRIEAVTLTKAFGADAAAGGTVTLDFALDNLDPTNGVSSLAFSDDLDAVLPGLVATGLPIADVCGPGSQMSGTSFLTLSGAGLAPGGSCSWSVTVQLPVAVVPGSYVNTTSDVTGGGLVVGAPASATLTVVPPPSFSKSFAPTTVAVGGISTMTWSIDNTASTLAATGLDVTDTLPAGMVVATPADAATTCTGGTLTAVSGTSTVAYTGGSVAAGASCTVTVDVLGTSGGTLVNTTGELTSSSGSSGSASATLTVTVPPSFSKSFAPTTVALGGVSTMTWSIDNTASTLAATGLDVTDTLPAGMVVATPANAATTCTGGTLTAVSGTSTVAYTGGSVAAGASCTVTVDVLGTSGGTLVNTTGELTSSSGSSGSASATLTVIVPPSFSKSFAPTTVAVGGISTMTWSIDNTASTLAATGLDVTDSLPAGMVVATPPNAASTCTGGTLTAVSGTSTVAYTGGSVAAGASCTVTVDVLGTSGGTLVNTTGELTSSSGSSGTATATLTVVDAPFAVTKSFSATPVLRGGAVDLEFTITNLSPTTALSTIAFTDDLAAALPGLAASVLPATDVCGPGSTLSGSGVLTFSGGSLGPGASCTFAATLAVPPDAPLGVVSNSTSDASAQASGVTVTAPPAAASFEVDFLIPAKAFDGSALPGGTVTLSFTVTNPDPVNPASGIAFTDDLGAVLPGLEAIGLPAADVCGAGSQLTGPSVLTLTGGVIPPAGSCTFGVTVRVPATASSGTYPNVTSPIQALVGGTAVSGDATSVASADLVVAADATAIPTLSGWSLLAFVGLLAAAGWWALRSRP